MGARGRWRHHGCGWPGDCSPGLEEPGPPTRPFLRGLSLLLAGPEAFRQTQVLCNSVGPNPSPEAYALAKMGKRILWLKGIIGDAWAGQMSTSDKTSTLNSLERISESGRKTSAPTSRCSLANLILGITQQPQSHTEPHSETMWKGNLDLTLPVPASGSRGKEAAWCGWG